MEEILLDNSRVVGQIYIMINTLSNKNYVGQTVSHRKNRGKYRPFGYIGRFKDHISEAQCNTKKKQCRYLNNAIRKDGPDKWEVKLLEVCPVEQLDIREQHYIREYNSLYPNGYNLTPGGKTSFNRAICLEQNDVQTAPSKKRGGCVFRSQNTRALISKRIKQATSSSDVVQFRSESAKQQHLVAKLERFKGVTFDQSNIEQYIITRQNCVVVQIDSSSVRFTGKHETIVQLKQRALEFLRILATLPNCSGNP